jgi:hypothetical protein
LQGDDFHKLVETGKSFGVKKDVLKAMFKFDFEKEN